MDTRYVGVDPTCVYMCRFDNGYFRALVASTHDEHLLKLPSDLALLQVCVCVREGLGFRMWIRLYVRMLRVSRYVMRLRNCVCVCVCVYTHTHTQIREDVQRLCVCISACVHAFVCMQPVTLVCEGMLRTYIGVYCACARRTQVSESTSSDSQRTRLSFSPSMSLRMCK